MYAAMSAAAAANHQLSAVNQVLLFWMQSRQKTCTVSAVQRNLFSALRTQFLTNINAKIQTKFIA